jgi:hypothetical protein
MRIYLLFFIVFLSIPRELYPQSKAKVLFEKVSPKKSGIKFKNTLTETDTENMLSFLNFYTGAGFGIIDGPYSASTGGLITLDSANNISIIRGHENGFNVPTEARALASLVMGNQKRVFIVTSNRDSIKVFPHEKQGEKHIRLGIIDWNDGLRQKQEFYYGSGYLSQSSRYLSLMPGWKKVKIVTYTGKERLITPGEMSNIK